MKISKLLSMILGLSSFLRMGVIGDDGGGMSMFSAAAALAGGAPGEEGQPQAEEPAEEESDEQLAERLAAEEAAGATQANGDEEEEEAATAPEDDTITIQVDGKDVRIKKSELSELYKGNLRQKDYTQKTMATAEAAKAAEAETAKARQEREHYAQQLSNFSIAQNSLLAEQEKLLTQELLDTDPQEYLRQERTLKLRQAEVAKANAELQRLHGEYQAEQQQQFNWFIQEQHASLVDWNADLKDNTKFKAFMDSTEKFLESKGFKAEDGKMLLDARFMRLADSAAKYEALMEKARQVKSTVTKAPVKVERPGTQTSPTDGRTKGMQRLKQTGNMNDAAALLMR